MADENKDLIFPMHLDIDVQSFEKSWEKAEPQLQAILDRKPLKAKLNVDLTGVQKSIELFQKIQEMGMAPKQSTQAALIVANAKATEIAMNGQIDRTIKLAEADQKGFLMQEKRTQAQNKTIISLNKLQASDNNAAASASRSAAATNKQSQSELQLEKTRIGLRTSAINLEKAELNLERAKQRGISAVHTQNKAYQAQRGILNGLPQFVNSYVSILGAYRLGQNIVDTTAEFEMQRVALAAIIQNKQKADELFAKDVELGLQSPFQIKELITYTKQLAAYRIESDSLFETTKRLADISAGLGVDMSRLVLAYGQVKAASVLRGQELRQFTEAGIPLIQLLADKFTKLNGVATTTGDVFKLISERGVSFEMVKSVFDDLTNAGGTFYRMQEIQAQTLKGSLSNLKDAYQKMFMQIGNENMGPMKGAIDGIKELMSNWRVIGEVATDVAVGYGVAKLAILAYNAALGKENAMNIASIMAAKKKEAALLTQASAYRTLNIYELSRIASSKTMTAADWAQLAVEGKLTKEGALRLIAVKRMTVADATLLKGTLRLTTEEIAHAASMGRTKAIMMMATATVKAYTAAIWASTKALLTNPLTWALVAAAGLAKLVSHIVSYNKAYSDMAKNIRKESALLANEMSDAFQGMSEIIAKGFAKGASNEAMVSARKSLQDILEKNELIKDILDIQLTKIDNEAERLGLVKEMWDTVHAAAASGKGGDMAAAQKATGGLLDNDVVESAELLSKKLAAIDKYLADMGGKGYNISGLRTEFEAIKTNLENGEISLSGFNIELLNLLQNPAATKNATLFEGLEKRVYKAGDATRSLDTDMMRFTQNTIDRIGDINGEKIIPFADKLGLSQENLLTFQTRIATETNLWIQSLGDIDAAAKKLLITQVKLQNQFPFRPAGEPDKNAFAENYNAFLKRRGLSKIPEADTENYEVTDVSQLEKEQNALKDNEATLKRYNAQVAAGNKLNQSQIAGLKELIRQQKIAVAYLGGTEGGSNEKTTDPRIATLKSQLSLIQEAYSKYLEYSKLIGEEEAKKEVTKQYGGQNKPISGITKTGLPLVFTQGELDAAYSIAISGFKKIGKDAVDEGRSAFLKQSDAAFDEMKRTIQTNLDKLAADIEQTQRANEFYEKMLGLTGSKDAAEKLTKAMGMTVGDTKKDMQKALGATMKVGGVDYGAGVSLTDVNAVQEAINKMPEDTRKSAQKQLDILVDYEKKQLEEIYSGLEDYMTAEQKKVKIAEETAKRIEQIRTSKAPESEKAGLISAAKRKGAAATTNVDFETLKSLDAYVQAFEDLDRVGNATLVNLKAELTALAATVKNDPVALKVIMDQIEKINKTQENRNPFGSLVLGMREYKEAIEELTEAEKKYGVESKQFAAAQNKVKKSADKMSDGMKNIQSDFNEVSSAINSVIDLTKKIADQFGLTFSDETQEYIDTFTSGIEIAAAAIGVLTAVVTILDTVLWPLLLVAVAIGAAFIQWKILDSIINMSTTKKLAANVKMIETLEERLKQLASAEDDVIGTQYVKNIQDQIAANKKLIEAEQSNIETNKKGKHFLWWSWADKDAIKESKENIAEYYDDIEKLQEDFMQEMTGYSSIVDMAYAFADSWYNAWLSMDDTTDAIMEKFDEMVNSMIIKSILAEVVAAKLKPLFDDVAAAYANDNKLDMSELASIQSRLNGLAEGLNTDLNAIMGNWLKSGGVDKRGTDNLSGISASVASMSEDTANTLGGYFNSGLMQWVKQTGLQTQILAAIQAQDVKTPLANMYKLQQESLATINAIKTDTAIMVSRLNTLVENQNSTMISGGQKAVNVRLLN